MSLIHIASRLRYAVSNPHGWQQFLDEKYDGGKAQVPNPNHETVKRYPQVSVNHAMKDEHYRKHIQDEYHRWYGENKEKAKTRGRPKKVSPESVAKPESVETVGDVPKYGPHKALLGKYTVDGMLEKYKDTFWDGDSTHKEYTKFNVKSIQYSKTLAISYRQYTDLIKDKKEYEGLLKMMEERGDLSENSYMEEGYKNCKAQIHRYREVLKLIHSPDFAKIEIAGLSKFHTEKVISTEVLSLTDDWNTSSVSGSAAKMYRYLESKGVKGSSGSVEHNPTDMLSISVQDALQKAYAYQQAVFKHLGIKEITLYRGVSDDQLETDPPSHGDSVKIKARHASSWTSNPEVSLRFGSRVVKTTVSVDRIFLSPIVDKQFDGGYAMSESEFVVMGSEDLDCEVFLTPR